MYYLMYFTIILLSIICSGKKKYNKLIFTILISLLLIVIVGFRGFSVGIDTEVYKNSFDNIENLNHAHPVSQDMESGFLLLFSLFSFFTSDFFIVQFVIGSITIIGFSIFIYRNSSNIFISFLIFFAMFFFPTMNLMRQWLAMAIGINSVYYFKNKRIFIGYLLIAFSTIFHTTALILLIIPLIYSKINKNIFLKFTLFLTVFLSIFYDQIFILIIRYLPYRYSRYLLNNHFVQVEELSIRTWIYVIILLVFLFYFVKNRFQIHIHSGDIVLYLISTMLLVLFSFIGEKYYMFSRLGYYMGVFLVVSLPNILRHYIKTKILINIIFILAMLVIMYINLINDYNRVSPYEFINFTVFLAKL